LEDITVKNLLAATALASVLSAAGANLAAAQTPYLGEIRLFGYNFCPTGWQQAAGQTLALAQNQALFALYGTNFGGNGINNFQLPNLSGRAPYGQLANNVGEAFATAYGTSTVTLTIANLPAHTHQLVASTANQGIYSPANALLSTDANTASKTYASPGSPANTPMAAGAIGSTGGNAPVTVQSPALSLNWCVAMVGIFPSRP
jgi:microcystin-dependent protein